ncbi:MAG: hypothetical protein LBS61_04685 [Endomicrobium sp.]|nr:hypothetical protein [Endomicrobium sp.]
MKKVASMLLALALLVSPMKSAFAEDGIWNTVKGKAVAARDWIAENKVKCIIGFACAVGVCVCGAYNRESIKEFFFGKDIQENKKKE